MPPTIGTRFAGELVAAARDVFRTIEPIVTRSTAT
jgi:hypothetical protein